MSGGLTPKLAANSSPKASTDPPPATFKFEFTGPKPKIPTNELSEPLPNLSFGMATPPSTRGPASLPPWKVAGYIPPTTASPDFPADLLTTNLHYIIKIRDRSLLDHNWAVAYQCILKMIQSLKRNARNTEFIKNSIQSVPNATTFSSMLNYLQFDLFCSHVRLEQYDEAWEILDRLDFKHLSRPFLGYTAYKELISTAGFLDRAFKIPTAGPSILGTESDTRKRLLNQAEICCRKAIDAAIDGKVVVYGRPAQYELYAIMAIIKLEHGNLEEAVFWKSLVVADGLEIEKDLVSSPFLTRWVENYKQIQDPVLQNILRTTIEKTEGVPKDPKPISSDAVEQKFEGAKVERLDGVKELRGELAANLNEIKAILKQGLQDLRDERQTVEELNDELRELKLELEEDINRVRDEVDDLRDEFGDKLLEELQEGLDPKLTLDLRLESVSIANKRIAGMNRELAEKLNDLKEELLPLSEKKDS